MKIKFFSALLLVHFTLFAVPARAGFWDNLSKAMLATNTVSTNASAANHAVTNLATAPASAVATTTNVAAKPGLWSGIFSGGTPAALSQDQVGSGLKEALGKGVSNAVASLGRDGGYLANPNVKIQMPVAMQKIETGLRLAGQGQMVDDFVASMNHAAEKAVPVAAGVFGDAIKQMNIADAKSILSGTPDAATQFFRRTSQTNLQAKFYPLVQKATDSVGVTARYKALTSKYAAVNTVSSLFGNKSNTGAGLADVDGYVTDKAMDGLFKMVADEEKNIRANPLARTSDLLKNVFGAAAK